MKVQLSFAEPLASRCPDEPSSWCLIGGEVQEVLSEAIIRIGSLDHSTTELVDGTGLPVYEAVTVKVGAKLALSRLEDHR